MPIELVIFDCDGVLVDSERLANAVLADLLTEAGLPTTADESIATYMGLSMASCVALAEERLGASLPVGLPRPLPRRCVRGLRPGAAGRRRDRRRARSAAVAECVASSGEHERMRRTLGRTGLHEHFAGRIYSATDVERGKPHPDLFLHAADRMGVDPARLRRGRGQSVRRARGAGRRA